MAKGTVAAILFGVVSLLVSCGGDSSMAPPSVFITITQGATTVDQGSTTTYNATVTGSTDQAVTWSVQEGGGGSISASGLYTAPATGGQFHVVATSHADPTKSAVATVTVREVTVTVSPATFTLDQGAGHQFSGTVAGTALNTSIVWSVEEGDAGGSITSSGFYTAPGRAGQFHVVARSLADGNMSATATVDVRDIVVTVTPGSLDLDQGATQSLSATVTGTILNTEVSWSVLEGPAGGSISAGGIYTAPPAAGQFHLVAASVADSTKAATVTATVHDLTISINPSTLAMGLGEQYQFRAYVTGSVDKDVTWSVQEGTTGGSVGNGYYTAPTSAGDFHVIATSHGDPSKSASAVITVRKVSITISPGSATLGPNEDTDFTAEVVGSVSTVKWSVQEPGGGLLDVQGWNGAVYTAPMANGTYHVVATSKSDPTVYAIAAVTVAGVGVEIIPSYVSIDQLATQPFTANVAGTDNKAVNWSIAEGAAGGTVDSTGLYSSPGKEGTFQLVATSVADPTKTATAVVSVKSVSVAVNPLSAAVDQGGSLQFNATVSGTTNKLVNWSVIGAGEISATGLYTAPNSETSVNIVAISQADPTKQSGAFLHVMSVSVWMNPGQVGLQRNATRQFSAQVVGTVVKDVTWSVEEGETGGTVTSEGVYTAPGTLGTYHLKATSVANPTKTASLIVVTTDKGFKLGPDLTVERSYHTATLLQNGDVLIAGGESVDLTLSSAEIFDHQSGTFRLTGSMAAQRKSHVAALLPDGRVLVAGGSNGNEKLASAEIYDPSTGAFTETNSMTTARSSASATVLSDGRILITGGSDSAPNSAEIFNPATLTFMQAAPMNVATSGDNASGAWNNLKAFAVGGYDPDGCLTVSGIEIFNGADGTFIQRSSMSWGRARHTATVLPDGRLLVAGGDWGGEWMYWYDTEYCEYYGTSADAEIYDPANDSFEWIGMNGAHQGHAAVLLSDGKVLIADFPAEEFDPVSSTFSFTGAPLRNHRGHTATVLPDGKVLLVGGDRTSELY